MLQIRFAIIAILLATTSHGYAQDGSYSETYVDAPPNLYLKHLGELYSRIPFTLEPPAVSLTEPESSLSDAQRRLAQAQQSVDEAQEQLRQAAEEAAMAEDKAKSDLQDQTQILAQSQARAKLQAEAQVKAAELKSAQLRADARAKEKAKLAAQVKAAQLRADAKAKERERKAAIEAATESPSDLATEGELPPLPASADDNPSGDSAAWLPPPNDTAAVPVFGQQTAPTMELPDGWPPLSESIVIPHDVMQNPANPHGVMENPYVQFEPQQGGCQTNCDCESCVQGIKRLGQGQLRRQNPRAGNLGNRRIIKSTAQKAKQVIQRIRCGAPACDLVGGCNQPGGCRSFGVIGGIKNRIAQRTANRQAPNSQAPNSQVSVQRPVAPIRNKIRSVVNGQQGVTPQPMFSQPQASQQFSQRSHGNGPLPTLARRPHCGSELCVAAGGCDQIGGCGGRRSNRRNSGTRKSNARNPGTLMMWREKSKPFPLPTLDDPIVSDRPHFTPASSVVGYGVGQVELGYTYSFNDEGPGSSKTHSYPETLLRYGAFHDWFELRLGWNMLDTDINGADRSGAEDLLVGYKIGLTSQRGSRPEMALIRRLRIPTGSDFLSKDEVLSGGGLTYRWQLNDTFSFAGSTQQDRDIDPADDERFTLYSQSLLVGYKLSERMAGYTEYFGLFPHSASTVRPEHFLNGGLKYLISKDLQFDARYGVNLDDDGVNTENYFAGMGLSLRRR